MRPNISNCHALPGTLIIFEWPDGSGKTTQIKILKKLLRKEGHKVTVSEWKSSQIIGSFLEENESLKKFEERILPETNLFLQAADMLHRIEREIIPALKKNHIVIMDRGLHTLIVRGMMLNMSEDQLLNGLLWWRNTIYKELFDKSIVIEITVSLEESMRRLQKRENENLAKINDGKKKKNSAGTLLSQHAINTLVYSSEWEKLTRRDKKMFIKKTQAKIIESYNSLFSQEMKQKKSIRIDGNTAIKEISNILTKEVIEVIV